MKPDHLMPGHQAATFRLHLPAELGVNQQRADTVIDGHTARDCDFMARTLAMRERLVCADRWEPFGLGGSKRLNLWRSSSDKAANKQPILAVVCEPF